MNDNPGRRSREVTMAEFPTAPDDLDTDWLTTALGFPVISFEVAQLGEGAGMLGLVTRLILETDVDRPRSVIAKFPSPVPDNRGVAHTYDMYRREVRFYQEIAPTTSMRTPVCHYADFDPASQDFVLLLEDLGHLRIGDQVAGCTLNEARSVLKAVAGLHASAWEPTRFPGLISHDNPMQRDGMTAGFQAGWPVVLEQFADLVPDRALSAGEKMPEAVGRLLEAMCRPPVSFSHGDIRLDNIFFDGEQVLFVDWQAICTSAPEQDVAYFITQSVPPDVRAAEDLLAYYHAELTNRGVSYSLERCRERYRVSALYLLCYAVIIAGTLDLANERGVALARTLLGNSLSALDELNAFSLLDGGPIR
jgi:hypothetical protein